MRKNILVLALLFCGMFSLAAQSRTSASIYVLPITGTGSKPEDNSIFYNQLVFELTDQYFNVTETPDDADFFLIGTLNPCTDEGQEGLFAFHLELRDSKTGDSSVEGDLLYETPDDIESLFPAMVSTLLYTIPEDPVKPPPEDPGINDAWRNKWLFVGASLIWTPRVYTGDSDTDYINFASFAAGVSAEFHILNFLSLEAGLELASDQIETKKYQNLLLEIPLLLKLVYKPSSWFMLEPYAGLQFNISLDNTTKPAWGTFLAGFQYSVKAGPGAFFIDARIGSDIGASTVEANSDHNAFSYQRTTIHIGFGYKFGIFQKKD